MSNNQKDTYKLNSELIMNSEAEANFDFTLENKNLYIQRVKRELSEIHKRKQLLSNQSRSIDANRRLSIEKCSENTLTTNSSFSYINNTISANVNTEKKIENDDKSNYNTNNNNNNNNNAFLSSNDYFENCNYALNNEYKEKENRIILKSVINSNSNYPTDQSTSFGSSKNNLISNSSKASNIPRNKRTYLHNINFTHLKYINNRIEYKNLRKKNEMNYNINNINDLSNINRLSSNNNIDYDNLYLSSSNYETFKQQKKDLIITAFKFYIKQKYENFDLNKMLNSISESERYYNMINKIKMRPLTKLFNQIYSIINRNDHSINHNCNIYNNSLDNEKIRKEFSFKSTYSTKSNKSNNITTDCTSNFNNNKTNIFSSSTKLSSVNPNCEFNLKTGVFNIPHVKKAFKGGEDAYKFDDGVLIIADGVGGWNSKGVDPALYSKTLVKEVYKTITEGNEKSLYSYILDYNTNKNKNNNNNKIKESIIKRLQNAIDKTNCLEGSSTVSFIIFDKNEKKAYTTYIGDSLYLIARFNAITKEYEIHYVSKEQSHGFNLPYQIGRQCDNADSAVYNEHELNNKDLFILATDGLWDNLHLEEIISTVNKISNKNKHYDVDTKILSESLVKKAQVFSFNK